MLSKVKVNFCSSSLFASITITHWYSHEFAKCGWGLRELNELSWLILLLWTLIKQVFLARTRSSWLNCALRDDEAVYWVSIGHYEAVAVGNWWYWVSRGHSCLYILQKVEIWTGVTDAWLTDWQTTLKDRATQLLIKYKSGALVTHYINISTIALAIWIVDISTTGTCNIHSSYPGNKQ